MMKIEERQVSQKIKNIEKKKVLTLKNELDYQQGQVISKTLSQNSHENITLFSFWKGEEISSHKSDGDAFITCLDGIGEITIDEDTYLLKEGESIIMPAGHPHAVFAKENFKMILIVIF